MRNADTALNRWAVSACLFVATFLVTRQTQIPALNGLGAPWALLVVLLYLRWERSLLWLAPMALYGACSVLASLVLGHDGANTLRFFAITLGTLLAFHFRPAAISAGWALLPVAVQAAVIAGLSIVLGLSDDLEFALAARAVALDNNWGDIYSFDGIYYRVQLIGNALVPLLFLISLWRWKQARLYRVMGVLSLLGLVAAGNLTYFLVAGLAVLIRHWKTAIATPLGRVLVALLVVAGIAYGGNATDELLERKFEGSDSSMGIRFDQLDTGSAYLADSPMRLLLGAGLGAPFPDGRERNYSESQYIELQSLYLFLQLGLVGSAIYLATLMASARRFFDADGQWIFWLYMLSGVTNPYILDTNQIVATMLLVCFFPRAVSAARRHPAGSPARAAAATP